MRKYVAGAAVVALSAVALLLVSTGAGAAAGGSEKEFVVLYAAGASSDAAHAAIKAAGGTVRSENTDVGVATVTTTNADFAADATAARAIDGVAQNRVDRARAADAHRRR